MQLAAAVVLMLAMATPPTTDTDNTNKCIHVARDASFYSDRSLGRGILIDHVQQDLLRTLDKIRRIRDIELEREGKEGRKE